MGVPAGRPGPRLAYFAFLCFVTALVYGLWSAAQPLRAQDQAEPAEQAPAVEQPAAPAAAPAPSQNLFKHIVRSAGIFFGPLLLVISIGLVALIALAPVLSLVALGVLVRLKDNRKGASG